ncbi:hypothetical protein [Cytobacillus firmus]|uniref:hypothetical protein n=1 Tax=Cytobacillus firmus TaxID=1399 RepID=UPI0018CD41F9|nr:hypothetical protein [Cytobacillus firmus]MBG9587628.1 hypothetical protein [Cytobacillus firmus]
MNTLFENVRVFEQQLDETQYLVLPEEKIKKYVFFSIEIAVKKGDLSHPNRWIRFNDTLIEEEKFNYEDYDLIFVPDKWNAAEVKEAIGDQLNIEYDSEFNNLLSMKEIPIEIALKIKEALSKYSYVKKGDAHEVEAFSVTKEQFLILDDMMGHNITYEYTEEFKEKVIDTEYKNSLNGTSLLRVGIAAGDKVFGSNITWYISWRDSTDNYTILRDLYEIEDIIPFTSFEKI